MISRRIIIGAGFHLVANSLPSQPIPTYLRPLFAARVQQLGFENRVSTTRVIRRIHSNNTTMSSTTASSVTPPADPVPSEAAPTTVKNNGSGSSSKQDAVEEEKKLPPLKGAEFRAYNRLAEHMDLFHAHFRTSWNTLWAAACAGNSSVLGKNKARGRAIISDGLAFIAQLEVHHNIEETYIFPVLARRMPEFKNDGKGGKGAAELLRQHQEIHVGMEGMRGYLRACKEGSSDLDMGRLKGQMESWGTVLWTHLDQEVKTLGAENMRKYWTKEEIRQIPM